MTLVPSSKLILWTGIVLLPFTALAATVSSAGVVVVIMVTGLTIIALIDAVLVTGRLNGIQVELQTVHV